MPGRYALRMQFGPNLDPATVSSEVLAVCRSAQVDEVVIFLFAEEQNNGHETLDEVRRWLETIRPWKEALQAAGIDVSLNQWITMLHCDRGRARKTGQEWQPMVDWKGQAATAVVCPLDPGWRQYYRDTLALYAAEGFRVIWLEDDIRLHNHAPLDWGGCFCPLHVAEFNRRAGTSATREEIVAGVLRPGAPHPWRSLWLAMWDETQTAMVEEFRRVVEPSGTQLGLMSSDPEAHAIEGRRWGEWWRALAGNRPPIHRPHFAGYSDVMGYTWPRSIALLDMNRVLNPPDAEVGPEIDDFPYGWAKSYRQTAAQMVLSQVFGSQRLNLSLYDFMGNLPSDDPTRVTFLAEWKPTLDWLSDLFPPTLRSRGIGCPWSQEMTRHKQTAVGADWRELHCQARGWAIWLGGFGHAFQMRPDETVNALAGDVAWALSDEEIRWLLSRGLLLDGPAAAVLAQRGFAPSIGMRDLRFITQADVLYSMAEMTDARFSLRAGAQVSLNERSCAERLLQGTPDARSQVVSILRDPQQRAVGHGVVVFENDLGGRVAVCPWDVNGSPDGQGAQRNVQRAAQVARLVDYVARGVSLGAASGAPYLVSQFLADGERWRGVVWNVSPDAAGVMRVRLPAGMSGVTEAVQIDARGRRLSAAWDGEAVRLSQPLQQWECVVLV